MAPMQNNAIELDVLVIGAGLSGLDAAWHLQRELPHLRYAILESRAELGGTWSLSVTRVFVPTPICTRWAFLSALGRGSGRWRMAQQSSST
jgi:cation diffusion facilitator CzcD-associated flavoprotein CzcO